MFKKMFQNFGAKVLATAGLNTRYDTDRLVDDISGIGRYFQTHSLSQIFPYESFDQDYGLYLNRSTIGFVLETMPLVGCTEVHQKQLASLFQHILPEGSNIQFLLIADPYVGDGLDRWCEPRHQESRLFSMLADKRHMFLSQLALKENSGQTVRTFRCLISVTLPCGEDYSPQLLSEVFELKERVREIFKAVGMPALEVDPDLLLQSIDDLVNPRFVQQGLHHSNLSWNPYQPIRTQIPSVPASVTVKKDGLYVNEGERVFRFYGVKRYPKNWSQSMMGNLIGDPIEAAQQIPCPFFIHYGVHIPAQQKLKLNFNTKATHVDKQARSAFAKFIPNIEEEAQENQFVRDQINSNQRFVQTNFTVGIIAPQNRLSKYDQALKNLYNANGWEIEENSYLHMQSMANILPMSWGDESLKDLLTTNKIKTTLSTESANLLPIQGEWYGTKSPNMLLLGRRGQIFTWSPFDNQEANYNVSVVGQSGSGKSVFMQELLSSILAQGGRGFVVDIGRSFKNNCIFSGGDFVEFKNSSGICLNPFSDINVNDEAEIVDALVFTKSIICTMACPIEGVSSLQAGIIEKAMMEAWENKKTDTTITDVVDILAQDEDITAKNLAKALYSYTKHGLYGHFFEGRSNITFKKQLTVIELEELQNNPGLQNVILQMLISVIANQIYCGDRKTRFAFVFDELWSIIRGSKGSGLVEDMSRRFRKYKSTIITGTQNLSDFYQSPEANAAYHNAAWKCILSQSDEVINQITNPNHTSSEASLNLSPFETETLRSIRTEHGKYSEVMIRGGFGFAVGRVFLDPFSRILYSTQSEEYSAVTAQLDAGKSPAEAIDLVARWKFPEETALWETTLKGNIQPIQFITQKEEISGGVREKAA